MNTTEIIMMQDAKLKSEIVVNCRLSFRVKELEELAELSRAEVDRLVRENKALKVENDELKNHVESATRGLFKCAALGKKTRHEKEMLLRKKMAWQTVAREIRDLVLSVSDESGHDDQEGQPGDVGS